MNKLKNYVDLFNKNDNELYKNQIPNSAALKWLEEEIPLFECPDKQIEEIYYFRWWTYRKHIKKTPKGYVVTEFLPHVPWSGKHNVINAAAGHHLAEGRWLKNSEVYLGDYINFFLENPKEAHLYSTWLIYAIWEFFNVKGIKKADKSFVKKLCTYYEEWERTNLLPNGMFWSIDDRDAMEMSISGTNEKLQARKGIRPTLNSYMCADSLAISHIAKNAGMEDVASFYMKKHQALKQLILDNLWDGSFFKAFHYDGDDYTKAFDTRGKDIATELIGYIPWYFNLAPKEYNSVFLLLGKTYGFYTEFGLTTARQTESRFLYEVNHECLWNGYIWPFATSQTLTALKNVCISEPSNKKYSALFSKLLHDYAKSQYITHANGKTYPWIDEVKHPYRNEWSSRNILRDLGWKEQLGGIERGKDYNHSTFCDLVITGIVGVDTSGKDLRLNPIIPEGWQYFSLTNLNFRGDVYDIYYDKEGTRYGKGKGLTVYKNNTAYAV